MITSIQMNTNLSKKEIEEKNKQIREIYSAYIEGAQFEEENYWWMKKISRNDLLQTDSSTQLNE